jgi:hypothetical protein
MSIPDHIRQQISQVLRPTEKIVGSPVPQTPVGIAFLAKTTEGREVGFFGIDRYLDEICAEYGAEEADAS